jgi:hypothetical protein
LEDGFLLSFQETSDEVIRILAAMLEGQEIAKYLITLDPWVHSVSLVRSSLCPVITPTNAMINQNPEKAELYDGPPR